MITVTRPYLPPLEEYIQHLTGVWQRQQLTNQGPLVVELENQLKDYLGVKYVCLVSSGTVALQIAIKAIGLSGEVIITPFTHVSTLNVLLWQNCTPVFIDIEKNTFCINPSKIESAITNKTHAILATHIYGYPCDVKEIETISKAHRLKVIYDAAHAFGVKFRGQSIFNFGDATAVSFHATKIFHTIEGGAIITNNETLAKKFISLRNFGLENDIPQYAGINGKNSELHAAMGLCNLPHVDNFIAKRKEISDIYKTELRGLPLQFPYYSQEVAYNFAYFPVVFPSEEKMLCVKEALSIEGIDTRRYFYPPLNKLAYLSDGYCPIAEEISKKVLCLPLYYDLSLNDTLIITKVIIDTFHNTKTSSEALG
jgi:dTDP-4-amino-4,6-dideoxygalactose transaminase